MGGMFTILKLPSAPLNELAGPFAVIVVGALFLVHGGSSGLELILHVATASTLVLSALAQSAVILSGEENKALRLFSALLLAVGGMLLSFYDAHPHSVRHQASRPGSLINLGGTW